MEACIIVTYRCNARCKMCNTWQHPSQKKGEFTPSLVAQLPKGLTFMNVTGGEPFLREDLDQILGIALSRAKRVVISTNGYFTSKIIKTAEKFGNRIGFRISIEGLPAVNDALRGLKDGFDHGIRSLTALHAMGIKDIGFGITVSDANVKDLMELYHLANAMNLEFATAVTHNSFYFHKSDNDFDNPAAIASAFEKLALALLASPRPKNWFRAYFNMGLANKVMGGSRPLPCQVGTDMFFVDPQGRILPCNGSDHPMIMGDLNHQSFNDIWTGPQADNIRNQVRQCKKQCWMIGSASPAMKKQVLIPAKWILQNKLKQRTAGKSAAALTPVSCNHRPVS